MNKKTALITGATSGIGYALAKIFAREQYDLVIVARNKEKLEEVKNTLEKKYSVSVTVVSKDLSKITSSQEIYDEIKKKSIFIDALINNAGFGQYGEFVAADLQTSVDMINLNTTSVTALTRLFLPDMIARNKGQILNVASTAAFQPGPAFGVYYATKAYVLSFSLALRTEVKNHGISVTCLCPGPTKTEFFTNNIAITESRLIQFGSFMSAEEVAESGYNALLKNKSYVIPGFLNKFVAFFAQVSPRDMVTAISAWTLKK